MNNSAPIAAFVNNLNIVTIIMALLLAAIGVFFIVNKKAASTHLRGVLFFLPALGVAALFALAAETTIFNLSVYLRFFSTGGETRMTTPSPDNPNVMQTTDGTHVFVDADGIHFTDLNRKVTSVYIRPEFSNTNIERLNVVIKRFDGARIEGFDERGFSKEIYKHLPHSNYTPVYATGEVSKLSITFFPMSADRLTENIQIAEIVINKPIPFNFNGLRMLAVSLIFFALFVLIRKNLRVKASYYLFDYKFDYKNRRQNFVYAFVVLMFTVFLCVNVYTSLPKGYLETPPTFALYYNKYLVDAIIAGRTWIDAPPLVYDSVAASWRMAWRIEGESAWFPPLIDWAWYEGKWYNHLGVVPAVLFFCAV